MVVEIPIEEEIRCSAERIFDVVIDLRGQGRWLGRSFAFNETVDVSENPVILGSTYREPTLQGTRYGTVTEFERPTRVTFHQPMDLRPFGRVDIIQRYTLQSLADDRTRVQRLATLGIPAYLRPVAAIVVKTTKRESARTLLALKSYCERLA